jgi:hypothetical protein
MRNSSEHLDTAVYDYLLLLIDKYSKNNAVTENHWSFSCHTRVIYIEGSLMHPKNEYIADSVIEFSIFHNTLPFCQE